MEAIWGRIWLLWNRKLPLFKSQIHSKGLESFVFKRSVLSLSMQWWSFNPQPFFPPFSKSSKNEIQSKGRVASPYNHYWSAHLSFAIPPFMTEGSPESSPWQPSSTEHTLQGVQGAELHRNNQIQGLWWCTAQPQRTNALAKHTPSLAEIPSWLSSCYLLTLQGELRKDQDRTTFFSSP